MNISRLYFFSKIYTYQLMKMNYFVNMTASVFIVNRNTLEHSQTFQYRKFQ